MAESEDRGQFSLLPAFELSDDYLQGFKQAVRNGQTRLALEYLAFLIDSLATVDQLETLAARIDETSRPAASTAQSRRVGKGKAEPATGEIAANAESES